MTKNNITTESGVGAKPARSEQKNQRVRNAKHSKAQAMVPEAPVYDRDAIARIAYSYWEARGRQGGSAQQDWLRAEQEYLKGRSAAAGA